MSPRLLSVHVAKAGGASTGFALREAFGDRLALDYTDDPANPTSVRNLDPRAHLAGREVWPATTDCIHGHFHPAKYGIPKNAYVFTVLREPTENIISIHYFWKSAPVPMGPLGEYAKHHCATVLETAQLPLLRKLYSETYFGGFDMRRFNRIGRYENYERVLRGLAQDLAVSFPQTPHLNITPVSEERALTEQDSSIRSQLRDLLIDDLKFYDRWANLGG
jgi:hypothetical protein